MRVFQVLLTTKSVGGPKTISELHTLHPRFNALGFTGRGNTHHDHTKGRTGLQGLFLPLSFLVAVCGQVQPVKYSKNLVLYICRQSVTNVITLVHREFRLVPLGGNRQEAPGADGVESSIRVAAMRKNCVSVFCHLKTSYLGIGQRWKKLCLC